MGCYNGAEICELIEHQINNAISKENIGLCKDDRLGIFKNMSSPEVEREKKDLVRLSITVKTNLKAPNFLDIHSGIKENICQPYKKPNDELYTLIRIPTISQWL